MRTVKKTLVLLVVAAGITMGIYYAGVVNCKDPESTARYTQVIHGMDNTVAAAPITGSGKVK